MKKAKTINSIFLLFIFNLLLLTGCNKDDESYMEPIQLEENEILLDVQRSYTSYQSVSVIIQDTISSVIKYKQLFSNSGDFIYFGKVNDYYKQKIKEKY